MTLYFASPEQLNLMRVMLDTIFIKPDKVHYGIYKNYVHDSYVLLNDIVKRGTYNEEERTQLNSIREIYITHYI